MKGYKAIAAFTIPSELAVVKSFLEAAGISCYVKDELTIQVHNFYSNAIGGITLAVKEMEAEHAIKLLGANGFEMHLTNMDDEKTLSTEEASKKEKLFKLLKGAIISVVIAAIILIIIIVGLLIKG
ncbi:MAG: hypothetical protein ACI849_001018 [Patiriisocius sp.]|jgi:hypothetical protein